MILKQTTLILRVSGVSQYVNLLTGLDKLMTLVFPDECHNEVLTEVGGVSDKEVPFFPLGDIMTDTVNVKVEPPKKKRIYYGKKKIPIRFIVDKRKRNQCLCKRRSGKCNLPRH